MGLGSEDQKASAPTVESRVESQKRSKISYGRDFLLSICELDICKRLPVGFDTLALRLMDALGYTDTLIF
ncbi:hypothetical protein AAC387_Pa08g1939 [Persea americana]